MAEGFDFGSLRIAYLLFTEDVILLSSSGGSLQLVLEQFAAKK